MTRGMNRGGPSGGVGGLKPLYHHRSESPRLVLVINDTKLLMPCV